MRGLLTTSIAAAAAAGLTAGAVVTRPVRARPDGAVPFYAQVDSDRRHDHPGLRTEVVAGATRLLVDLDERESLADRRATGAAPDGVLLTRLDRVTPASVEALITRPDGEGTSPLRVWGPAGTARVVQTVAAAARHAGRQTRIVVAADIAGGLVDVNHDVSVRAIALEAEHLAYLVRFDGRGLLVASDMASSCAFAALTDPVDLVVVRHSSEVRVAGLLSSIGPRRAVLAQDGVPASARGVRESYGGPFEFAPGGTFRVAVPRRPRVQQQAMRVPRTQVCS